MAYSTITIRICQFLIQIQGWYSHSSINSEKMQKSEWTISWSGWESQEKILFEKLTKKILKIQSWKAGKKILFPFEKFYPKKIPPVNYWKFWHMVSLKNSRQIFFLKIWRPKHLYHLLRKEKGGAYLAIFIMQLWK